MNAPLVTVIIPCFNCEKHLAATLDSVLAQTYTNLEILCVDNNSKDATTSLIEAYVLKDSRVKFLQESQIGADFARNKGLKNARGEFLQFLDSDDLIVIDKLETQVKKILETGADVVVSDRRIYDAKMQTEIETLRFPEIEKTPLAVSLKQIIITGNPLYKKTAVNEINGWNEELSSAQDWDFNIRLALNNKKFVYAEGVFLYCRSLENSLSSNWIKVNENAIKVLNELRPEIVKNDVLSDQKVQQKIFFTYFIGALYATDSNKHLEALKLWNLSGNGGTFLTGINKLLFKLSGLKNTIRIRKFLTKKGDH